MTQDYAILENFQLLIPGGRQQVLLSSVGNCNALSQSCVEGGGVDLPCCCRDEGLYGKFHDLQRRSLQGLCCPMSEEAVGHVQQKGAYCQKGWNGGGTSANSIIFQAKPLLLFFLFFSCCRGLTAIS